MQIGEAAQASELGPSSNHPANERNEMQITLQYFEGCPNWKETDAHLEALRREGLDIVVARQLIETPEAAAEAGFRGSPTVLINGADPFSDPGAPVGLACRVYRTDEGHSGSPSPDQLRQAINQATG